MTEFRDKTVCGGCSPVRSRLMQSRSASLESWCRADLAGSLRQWDKTLRPAVVQLTSWGGAVRAIQRCTG